MRDNMRSGKVWLVGAGPGDAALITVKGLHAIRQAEALVYDRLVSAELLAEAPDGCEMINVGKHPITICAAATNQSNPNRLCPARPERSAVKRRRSLCVRAWRRRS